MRFSVRHSIGSAHRTPHRGLKHIVEPCEAARTHRQRARWFSIIVLEDLNVRGMLRNRRLTPPQVRVKPTSTKREASVDHVCA
jgi:hypothetical protein